jgi:hypothetical protein
MHPAYDYDSAAHEQKSSALSYFVPHFASPKSRRNAKEIPAPLTGPRFFPPGWKPWLYVRRDADGTVALVKAITGFDSILLFVVWLRC